VPQQELDLFQVAAVLAAELMGWSAASTLFHLGYKRCTEEVPCKYTQSALILARRCFTWLA
jgi:hypothetical protein